MQVRNIDILVIRRLHVNFLSIGNDIVGIFTFCHLTCFLSRLQFSQIIYFTDSSIGRYTEETVVIGIVPISDFVLINRSNGCAVIARLCAILFLTARKNNGGKGK